MHYFTQGFFTRTPAWHKLGVVLDDFPGREEGMRLAGHDFDVVERQLGTRPETSPAWIPFQPLKGWKALEHGRDGNVLNVVRSSYEVIQNTTGWDVVDAIIGAGAKYETGITLKDGAVCLVTAWLDEPIRISGDDSDILPYLVVRWTHDGSGSLVARSTSVRVVCANTDEASAIEARRNKTEFVFRHTKNVHKRIEEAKMALRGLRDDFEEFRQAAEELAAIPVSESQRRLFVSQLIPMPPEALISDRVVNNVETARAAIHSLFDGPTIPEQHKLTAYGLRLAGVEYLDHLRGYRNDNTYVGRQLLRTEPAKVKLTKLIREVVKA